MHAGVADGYACWEGEDVPLTDAMRRDYEKRFASLVVNPNRKAEVETIITRAMKARSRYQAVAARTGVPWFIVAVIHNMECGGRFDCHLHNGNPLTGRTVDEPPGRPRHMPASGKFPFTWEESAVDALQYDGFDVWQEWTTVPGALYKLECYNGFGSRNRGTPTAYLWAGCQHDLNADGKIDAQESNFGYHGGKYVKDRVWNPKALSSQIGAAVLLRRMNDQHLIEFPVPRSADPKCEGIN